MQATLKETTLYRTTTNSDLTEGRGGTVEIGWFLDEDIAKEAAKGRGVMGCDGQVEAIKKTIVTTKDGKTFILGPEIAICFEDPAKIRERALAKLTPAEKKVLGLK